MTEKLELELDERYLGHDFTKIIFTPDYERFNVDKMNDEIFNHFKKRVIDLAGILYKIDIFFNSEKIQIDRFKDYVDYYFNQKKEENIMKIHEK